MDFKVSKAIFSKESILKVVYLWQKDFNIVIEEDEYNYILNISSVGGAVFNVENFNKELQEQQLRETLNNQFGTLRDSIYNKAFEHFLR